MIFRLERETVLSLSRGVDSFASAHLGFSFLRALLRWASALEPSSKKEPPRSQSTTWWVERSELEATRVWKEEREPRVEETRPPWWKIKRGCPCAGLGPCCQIPCGGWRGKCEDLAVCRVHVILWASRRGDYILPCGNENVGQEMGLAAEAKDS